MRTTPVIGAVLVLTLALGACAGGNELAPGTGARTITIRLFAYDPAALTLAAGTPVEWRNGDDAEHTVTAGTPDDPRTSFDSGTLAKGAMFRHPFEEPGRFAYFCGKHPTAMRGEVVVTS